MTRLFLFILFNLCINSVLADTIFTYREKESINDTRYEYDRQLLDLALKKTEQKYGPYKLVPSEAGANTRRCQIDAETGRYENFFFKQSVTPDLLKTLAHIPFPIDRGIVGYRVAFISNETKEKLTHIKTIDDLKKLTVLQGIGWPDAEILEQHGFTVFLTGYYEPMFKMIARNRADLFLRGANELLDEWKSHKTIKDLTYDQTIVIHYLLPRFFFTTKTNTEAIKRVQEGIMIAYHDGSLIKLWQDNYQASIDFASLKNRKIFELDNHLIDTIDPSFIQYNYDPFE